VTLDDAIKIALHAYAEDDQERERILELLVPIVVDRNLLREACIRAWNLGCADHVRAALTEYQAERARIDAEAAADATAQDTCRRCARPLDVDGECMDCVL